MPLTLGNECAGIVEKAGRHVTRFIEGDRVYCRVPISRLGAFAEYVVIPENAAAHMPDGLDFAVAAAIPLTGLTAYQAITEELHAKQAFLSAGADQYLVYTEEKYWECLAGVDYIIDTLGEKEFAHELSVLKEGGILLSLRTVPNKSYAKKNGFPLLKQMMFSLAGLKYDMMARHQGKEYRFIFVRADGMQLEEITRMVETEKIVPQIDSRKFDLMQINDAVRLVHEGHTSGKVIVRFP